jgi:hypothetical protein
MSGASVTIGSVGLTLLSADTLSVDLPAGGPITASWNSTTKTLTLNGVATTAEYEAALQAVTWNVSGLLNLGTRKFTFVVRDLQGQASTGAELRVNLLSLLG